MYRVRSTEYKIGYKVLHTARRPYYQEYGVVLKNPDWGDLGINIDLKLVDSNRSMGGIGGS